MSLLGITNERWLDDAVCGSQPDDLTWHPSPADTPIALADARPLCGSCPVRVQCLEWALVNDEHGIWGGTTREERQRMKRKQVTA